MSAVEEFILYLLAALAAANIARILYQNRSEIGFVWEVWARFRVGMFLECIGVIAAVIAIGFALVQVPILEYGWLHLFYSSGGNVFIRPLSAGAESTYTLVRWIPVLFFTGFFVAIPFVARIEEDIFRRGHVSWRSIIRQSCKFGPLHCLVGIPLAFGIALIVSGLFYGYHYKRAYERNIGLGHEEAEEEAVMVCTAYHSMYNSILIGVAIIVFALNALYA